MRKILLTCLIAATGLLVMLMPQPVWEKRTAGALPRDRDRLIAAFDRLRLEYVDEIDQAAMVTVAIKAMTEALENSEYIDIQTLRDLMLLHKFAGLGLALTKERGHTKVVAPIDGGPAAQAGLKPNDIITHVDDVSLQHLTLDQVNIKLHGLRNTEVRLRISRSDKDEPREMTVIRDHIHWRPVRFRLERDGIGYIRVAYFNERISDHLQEAFRSFADRMAPDKLTGYVLDLRNNAGGTIEQAVSTADAFLHNGEIVSVRGRSSAHDRRFSAGPGDLIDGKPLITLINRGSAAGAEIVAGALQDHRRATVVGTRSFGKGSVANVLTLGSGNGALRLTTRRCFTPAGRSIQAQGIVPDVEAYEDVPENPENDGTLQMAYAMLRGTVVDPVLPPG